MSNPWLRKNPYLSLWLSGVNAVVGATRGQASAEARRQAALASRRMTEAAMSMWLGPFAPPKSRSRKRR